MESSSLQRVSVVVLGAILIAFIQYGESHPSPPLDILNKRDTAAASTPNSIVQLVSLERSPTANGNRFKLRFTKDVDDVLIHVQDNVVPPRAPDSVSEEEDGVWVATFDLPTTPHTVPSQWLILADYDIYHLVAIMLNNDGTETMSQDIVELPVIHTDPATEAVYSSGEDVLIKAFVPRNSQTGELIFNMHKSFMGLDLNSMEFHMDLDDEDLYTMRPPESLADTIRANMTIHTSTRPISGYLQLTTDVYSTGGSLAEYIQVSRSIIVRPSTQAGPYPTGYLTIKTFPGQTSENGNELKSCRVGSECLINCFASGQAISAIEVKEVSGDGSLVDVPSAQTFSMATATSNGVFWTFQAEVDSGDSHGITTFRCKVTDDVHGTFQTKLVDVQATVEGSIDSEGSSVTMEEDPADPSKTMLTFRCAVKGRPLPEVYFEGYAYNMAGDSPDQVVTTGQGEAVLIKVVTMDSDTLAFLNSDDMGYRTPAPKCMFYDPFNGNYVEHTFTVPDPSSHVMLL